MDVFWENNGDKVLVGIITAIVVLLLSEPIKALLKKFGDWIERIFQSLGFGFQKRYYYALIEGLFGISRGDAIYGGAPIKQTCDSLRYQGRAVGTKLYCEECRNSGVWLF